MSKWVPLWWTLVGATNLLLPIHHLCSSFRPRGGTGAD